MKIDFNNTKIRSRFTKLITQKNLLITRKNLLKRHFIFSISKSLILTLIACCFFSCDKTHQYARKGNHKYNKKEYAKAINDYKQSLKQDSTFAASNYNMGNALMQDSGKDYAQAVKYYNKYLEKKDIKNPKQAKDISRGLYNRGNAFFGLSQANKAQEEGMKYLQQAAQDYKQAMILNPKDSNAKYNYAMCLWLMKNNNNPDNNNNNQNDQSNSEINQMLQAMKNNEKQTISKVKKHKENVHDKKNEKDW